jgi:hypothetical protein
VRNFTAFLGGLPGNATKEDVQQFRPHIAQRQISPGLSAIAALRFFFSVCALGKTN